MPARATCLAPALALGAALALAACDEPPASAPPPGGAQYPERTIRVLDPGGRLYDHGQDPDWRTLDPATGTWVRADLRTVYDRFMVDPGELPAGRRLAVLAQGCRIEWTRVPETGESVVRLRRGLPVPLRVEWGGRLPRELLALGVALERPNRPEDGLGAFTAILRSVGADWMDHDLPSRPDWTVVPPEGGDVLLYVPEPGRYSVRWVVSWRNGESSTTVWKTAERRTVEVGAEGAPEPVRLAPPAAWIDEQRARASAGSPR